MAYNHAIIGYPLNKTFSPLLHSKFFAETGINGGYTAFNIKEIDELPILMHFLERFNFTGINIASPHKESIIQYVQEVDESVRLVGAANVLKHNDHGWKAYNTDALGFLHQLNFYNIDLKGKKILIIGAGSAAKAVVWALKSKGIKEFTIVNRSEGRVNKLKEIFKSENFQFMRFEYLKDADLFDIVINAIPIDWTNQVWLNRFWSGQENFFKGQIPEVVMDLQYRYDENAKTTPFLSLWSSSYKYDGFCMLVEKAALSFEIWCGIKPSYELEKIKKILYR